MKDDVMKLTWLLTFFLPTFFCVLLDSRYALGVVLLYFFLFISLFSCWFTLRNLALGRVSFVPETELSLLNSKE